MNVGVVAPQSSHWEDSNRAASILVKAFQRLEHRAWLITSVFHDGSPAVNPTLVERSERGFVELERDVSGVPTLRVLSAKALLPGGGIVLRNFSRVLNDIVDTYSLDVVVVFSSFWNGPEEVAKLASVRKSLTAAGEVGRRSFFVYIPIYFTKFYFTKPVEYASRVMWATLNMPFILHQIDLVIICCQQEAAELKQFRALPERVVESKNWIDPELAEALDSAPKGPVEDFEYIVSYVGPLEGDRNVHLLVKVAEKLQGKAGVVVAGGGEAAHRLRREAAARKNLVLLERHDVRQIASIIKSSIAGVDFSPCEPMGIRALEYLYAGVPFAASPGSRALWYITDGVEGIHLDYTEGVDKFVKWVDTLIKKPEMREEVGRRARRKAEGLIAVKLAELIAERARQA